MHSFTIQEIIDMSIIVDVRKLRSTYDIKLTEDLCSDGEFVLEVGGMFYIITEGEYSIFATKIGNAVEFIYYVGSGQTGLDDDEIKLAINDLRLKFRSVVFMESDSINSIFMEKYTPISKYLDQIIAKII